MTLHIDLDNNHLSLRNETAEDQSFLFKIYSATRQDEMALVDWSESQKDAFLQMQFNAQHQYYADNYPGAQYQVILWNNQPIGRLYLHQRQSEIRIMDISILPEYQNAGIGSTLLRGVLARGSQLNLPVTIHVERINRALRLYQRLGFQLREDKGVYLFLEWQPPRQGA
jgi:ribosomal protein S18 acetylase RimI-like enzyme